MGGLGRGVEEVMLLNIGGDVGTSKNFLEVSKEAGKKGTNAQGHA